MTETSLRYLVVKVGGELQWQALMTTATEVLATLKREDPRALIS